MLTQHDLQHLIEANKALQSGMGASFERVSVMVTLIKLNKATLEYLQTSCRWCIKPRSVLSRGSEEWIMHKWIHIGYVEGDLDGEKFLQGAAK